MQGVFQLNMKKIVLVAFVFVLLSTAVVVRFVRPVAVELPVHNRDTGLDYADIQEAIDAPETRNDHTIIVDAGTYPTPSDTEAFFVNKQLTLLANGKVIIRSLDARGFIIEADHVTIQEFTITNLMCVCTGIRVWGYEYVNIINNTIMGGFDPPLETAFGIDLVNANCSNIVGNTIVTIGQAIKIHESNNCNITSNKVMSNQYQGIYLYNSDGCSLIGNNVTSNKRTGIRIDGGSYNELIGNNISSNYIGIQLANSQHNEIFHNHLTNNTHQVNIEGVLDNSWDNDYPSGGNYWSDYKNRYSNATELDDLGIWDTPYVIDWNNQDNYPLIPEFSSWIILPLFLTATVLSLVVRRRTNRNSEP